MPNESTRQGAGPSWPLRVGLGLCVSVLIIVGFQLKGAHHSPAAEATTTLRTTTSSAGPGPTTSIGTATTTTPTTQPPGPAKALPPPIVNMAAFKPPGAGCRFSTGAPIPVGTSGSTTTNASS